MACHWTLLVLIERSYAVVVGRSRTLIGQAGAGSMIELMKFDMGGSGCTLGAAKVQQPSLSLIALFH